MWIATILGMVSINFMLWAVHRLGPKIILITWLPAKMVILIITLWNRQDEFKQVVHYTWAANILPVVFFATFHLATEYRITNIPKHKQSWWHAWCLAIILMSVCIALITILQTDQIYLISGIAAVILNLINVTHAPAHIRQTEIRCTWTYWLTTNITVFAVLFTIQKLVEQNLFITAGLISNIPILTMALVALSSCKLKSSETEYKTMRQHIYMSAFQIWPTMALLAALWLAHELQMVVKLSLAAGALVSVLFIQYFFIKQRL